MINYGLITINTMFLPLVGMFVGFMLGIKINMKLNMLFYLIVGVFVAYLLGALPYYNFPMSYSFILSMVGLLFGNLINMMFKRN
ncbi:hypothetical protein Mjas_08320 [Methanothermococcus sp. Ax23]|uniref:hypothetical protein n=1 Tax=Methanothermococcus sp. Ax23 TaxID=3156486 RepID=UPI003BA20C36